MTRQIALFTTLAMIFAATRAMAQVRVQPWRASNDNSPAVAGPNQPVGPSQPHLQPRTNPPPPPPFRLAPNEEAYLDRVLVAWEQRGRNVKTFDCEFYRWVYDPVFGPPQGPKHVDWGKIKYAAPDKGMFRVHKTQKGREMVDIEPERAEHWVCNGQSVFEHNYIKKQVIEHKLPPEMRGKAIENGPLPFLFGANAAKLKQRYFLRVITPPTVQGQIWLESYPRFQQDAANFRRAELILRAQDMSPFALQIYAPNGKNRMAYQFEKVVVNDPLRILRGNPFSAAVPFGWRMLVEQPPLPQVSRQPGTVGSRR